MDPELKDYLELMESRTDLSLEAMESRMGRKFDDLNAKIEKMETNLLTGFYNWARPMEKRVNGMTTVVMAFEERLAMIESRVFELETKKRNPS